MKNNVLKKLIVEYRKTKSEEICKRIYAQFRMLLLSRSIYLIRAIKGHTNFLVEEYELYIYENFVKQLNVFNLKQIKYSFVQALIYSNKITLIRTLSKIRSQANSNFKLFNKMMINEIYENQINYRLERKEKQKQQQMLDYLIKRSNKRVRKVIKYKTRGFSARSISELTNIPIKQVNNIVSYFVRSSKETINKMRERNIY